MIIAATLTFHCVLVIADILAISVPAHTSRFLSFFQRIEERLETRVIITVGLV